jgi:hypothetical protein
MTTPDYTAQLERLAKAIESIASSLEAFVVAVQGLRTHAQAVANALHKFPWVQ